VSPKVKTTEGKGVWVNSLIRTTLRVKGHAGAPRWGLGGMASGSIIHMDMHKANNKFVSV
jgi:hypothetical protein